MASLIPPRPKRKEEWEQYAWRLQEWVEAKHKAQWAVMARALDVSPDALEMVADWARAWVQNETCLPEAESKALPEERAGMALLRAWGVIE